MNMNDNEWNEFWDQEPDEDDDEYNDLGSDIDANNDETFDNAAEWDEDEHEELIARDSILSHSIRSNNSSSNSRPNAQVSGRINNINDDNNNKNDSSNVNSLNHSSGSRVSNVIGSAGRSGWNSVVDKDLFSSSERQAQSTSSGSPWQAVNNTTDRLHLLQLQQQQLLLQKSFHEQVQRQHQLRDMHILQQQQHQEQQRQHAHAQADLGRQVLRVDELERQLLKTRLDQSPQTNPQASVPEMPKRSGWSPFGGKDLFTNPDIPSVQCESIVFDGPSNLQNMMPQQSLTLQQQQQILLIQKQQQLQQMAIRKQQQIQQEQRLMSQNPQCYTVEELERQMIANRPKNPQETAGFKRNINHTGHEGPSKPGSRLAEKRDTHNNVHDRRDNERHDRFERYNRDSRDNRDFKDRRDHREQYRDNHRGHRHGNRMPIVIPPQVQLKVIDKARRLHSITAMHPDEFLQDRMPTSNKGFLFKRHSTVLGEKANHDGVLTEKERNWLTKIQEKIQADYDDNLDQDYYYLLYFNRSSMTDEAAQKPYGPGVSDRRFIPRERLLYNSGT